MTTGDPDPVGDLGWPFLVAAGRRRDHAVLVAPDFLVEQSDYGMLAESVGPGREGNPAGATTLTTRSGQVLAVTHRTHLLLPEDLAGPEGLAAPDGPAAPSKTDPVRATRDEHNRPLRLLLGFVSLRPRDLDEVDADLDAAQGVVLDAYRDFLEDEDGFAIVASAAQVLRSLPSPTPGDPAAYPAATPAPPAPASAATHPGRAPGRALPTMPHHGRRRGAGVLLLVAVAVAVVALVAVFLSQRSVQTPQPCPTTTSAGVGPGESAAPPCPSVTPAGGVRPGLHRG